MIEKAARAEADEVALDLEDAVAPAEKEEAQETIIEATTGFDWNEKTLTVRVNSLDTQYAYRDLVDITEKIGGTWIPSLFRRS